MKIKYLFLLLAIFIFSCKEEVIMESKDHQSVMVIDGFLTNKAEPYTITISKSAPVNLAEWIPFENCIVTLTENTGKEEVLSEIEPGIYKSSGSEIIGIEGNSYSLSIYTPEGKEYVSDFQELKAPIGLDSVYANLESITSIDYVDGLPGYQFYANTKLGENQNNYFLWNITETYEYDIDYFLAYLQTRFGDYIYSNPRYDTLQTCWKTQKVNYLFTGKTENLTQPQIIKQPLHFIGTNNKKLTKRYSALIDQYTVSETAYNYWSELEELSKDENFLTISQPYNIKSNIENINDEEELVLGYFTVASISQKRIYVNRPPKPFYYETCLVITDRIAISDYMKKYPAPYFWVEVEDDVFGITPKHCIDCRTEGGELNKPDYWIDE